MNSSIINNSKFICILRHDLFVFFINGGGGDNYICKFYNESNLNFYKCNTKYYLDPQFIRWADETYFNIGFNDMILYKQMMLNYETSLKNLGWDGKESCRVKKLLKWWVPDRRTISKYLKNFFVKQYPLANQRMSVLLCSRGPECITCDGTNKITKNVFLEDKKIGLCFSFHFLFVFLSLVFFFFCFFVDRCLHF